MAIPLLFFGVLLLVSGVRNTQGDLFTLLKGDFIGPKNFIYWMVSILAIGAVGYVPKLRPLSDAFLVLVILVLFLENKGVFAQFTKAIDTTQTATPSSGSSAQTQSTLGSLYSGANMIPPQFLQNIYPGFF